MQVSNSLCCLGEVLQSLEKGDYIDVGVASVGHRVILTKGVQAVLLLQQKGDTNSTSGKLFPSFLLF